MSELVKPGAIVPATAHENPSGRQGPIDLNATLERHKLKFPPVFRPAYKVMMQDTSVELWVSHRRLPLLLTASAIVVPVAPDLKMIFGAAKMVRDYGGNRCQYEANRVAPLPPGSAFIGSGAKFRYKYTALAVIFDEVKRTSPGVIRQAYHNAVTQVYERGAKSVILPDLTANLLAQPNWITPEQKAATAAAAATLLAEAARACRGTVGRIKIWVWDPENVGYYRQEIQRLGS